MTKILILILLTSNFAHAVNEPDSDPNDDRLKTVVYKKNDIIPINALYKKATLIDLGKGNIITDVITGDSESWLFNLTSSMDGILAKPLSYDADTNLIIVTENRKYYFDLHRSAKAETYGVRFIYPDEEYIKLQNKIKRKKQSSVNSDLDIDKSFPEQWNFGYVLKGSKKSSPNNVFDDGKFTYFDFGKKDIPAIFSVDLDQREGVINFHKSGKYIVVENIYKQLILRNGNNSTCIYNKNYNEVMSEDKSIAMSNELGVE